MSAAFAELAEKSHLHWLWAQHSLWWFGLCHEESKGMSL